MWPFKKRQEKEGHKSSGRKNTPCSLENVMKAARRSDGTALGYAIAKGVYSSHAGSEKIGYFDPETAPFRSFPNNKVGLVQGPLADEIIRLGQASGRFTKSGDAAADLAKALGLSSTKEMLDTFQKLVMNEAVSQFLLVTTSMPFFLTYSTKKVVVSEVDHELKLNALANLLLNDPAFSSIRSVVPPYDSARVVAAFENKAASLLDDRKAEVEEKTQWAIDFQK